jgi:hypothetical protein
VLERSELVVAHLLETRGSGARWATGLSSRRG